MQLLLRFALKIISGVILGILVVPIAVVLMLPVAAFLALFDGDCYFAALWDRIKAISRFAASVGNYLGVWIIRWT
jgi:hypothetical protein